MLTYQNTRPHTKKYRKNYGDPRVSIVPFCARHKSRSHLFLFEYKSTAGSTVNKKQVKYGPTILATSTGKLYTVCILPLHIPMQCHCQQIVFASFFLLVSDMGGEMGCYPFLTKFRLRFQYFMWISKPTSFNK